MEKNLISEQKSTINFQEALQRMGGDENFLVELISDYLDEFKEYYSGLVGAVNDNDFEKIAVIGHTLKGSSAMLSLTLMHRFSVQMEKAGKEEDISSARKLTGMMKNESLNLIKLFPVSQGIVN